ncbi:unnamed protein product, partial [Ectocarpus sp. 12 AP-2014]
KTLPHFRKNKAGMFINISSIGGRTTIPLMPVYHSTKWAVEGFTESLRWEMAQIGVQVKLVEPGAVATNFAGSSLDMQHNPELTEYNEIVGKFTEAMSKFDPSMMSSPEVIAEVIYTAATDGKDTLRYRAGADALQLLDARSKMTDEEFFGMQKQQFGL